MQGRRGGGGGRIRGDHRRRAQDQEYSVAAEVDHWAGLSEKRSRKGRLVGEKERGPSRQGRGRDKGLGIGRHLRAREAVSPVITQQL